jgi:hypothetical protein
VTTGASFGEDFLLAMVLTISHMHAIAVAAKWHRGS